MAVIRDTASFSKTQRDWKLLNFVFEEHRYRAVIFAINSGTYFQFIFSQIYDLASHMMLILYIATRVYCLKPTPNYRFLEMVFVVILLTLRILFRKLMSGHQRKNVSFYWICLNRYLNLENSSNKPMYYVWDYGDGNYPVKHSNCSKFNT